MSEFISINVTMHGWLIKYFDYKNKEKVIVPKSTSVAILAEIITLPPKTYIAFLNGHKVSDEDSFNNNDSVHFYPLVFGG